CYLDRHLHVRTLSFYCSLFFSFTDTATTEIYTLSLTTLFRSLYGASSLANMASRRSGEYFMGTFSLPLVGDSNSNICRGSNYSRSEEHTSELQSRENLVCRLLLEKKNKMSK